MFGKRTTPVASDVLAQRVRQMAERAPMAAAPAQQVSSKTRAPRKPVFKSATLVLDDGRRLVVALKDLSEAGARIEFFQQTHLPDEVTLSEPTMKLRRRARVAWQEGDRAGLSFL